ncbi:hypothetical protein DPMN_109143 [Dreissena polymorpha]|uniref:Uncharacterized protein n=1 Tax=Dreissena polymorpha TaxID=45954 RepID=A0A9D4KA51_DREPO|nr:hypothetical protein DPMN_109143 [Dreissena polymorpha]
MAVFSLIWRCWGHLELGMEVDLYVDIWVLIKYIEYHLDEVIMVRESEAIGCPPQPNGKPL